MFSYGNISGVPRDVILEDANTVMREELAIKYRNGSYALGSNFFRYLMLQKLPYIWIDLDVLFLRKVETSSEYIFAWENEKYVNNAVFRAPSNSELLNNLIKLVFSEPLVAPWWDKDVKAQQLALAKSDAAVPLSDLEWGTSGPKALTHFIKELGLVHTVAKKSTYYPIDWQDASLPFSPGVNCYELLDSDTIAVHLWNHLLGNLKDFPPRPNCFIFEKCQEFGLIS